jgi:hypothetical protein
MFTARSSAFQSMPNISNRHAWSKVLVHETKAHLHRGYKWQVRPLSLGEHFMGKRADLTPPHTVVEYHVQGLLTLRVDFGCWVCVGKHLAVR